VFIKLCIQTRCYKQALPFIEKNIIGINKTLEYNEEDLYNYFYYAGHIFLILKKEEEAIYNFTVGMQTYVRTIHTAHVECRKKLILLLMRNQKAHKVMNQINFLRTLNPDDARTFEILTSKYTEFLSKQELLTDPKKFEEYVKFILPDLQKDNNLGLVKQLNWVHPLNQLKDLKKIYTQVGLSEINKLLKMDQNTQIKYLLFEIFQLKQLGRINSKLNTLVFEKIEDPLNTKTLAKIQERTDQLRDLGTEFNFEHEDIIRGRISNLFS